MLLWTTLFINQAAFIWMAEKEGIALWLIFLISFIYANLINFIFYYGTEWVEKVLEKVRGKKEKSRWSRICYIVLRRWSKKTKIILLSVYFVMPIIPMFGIKEACIIIAELERIKFRVLVIISIIQIIIIYYGKVLLF